MTDPVIHFPDMDTGLLVELADGHSVLVSEALELRATLTAGLQAHDETERLKRIAKINKNPVEGLLQAADELRQGLDEAWTPYIGLMFDGPDAPKHTQEISVDAPKHPKDRIRERPAFKAEDW